MRRKPSFGPDIVILTSAPGSLPVQMAGSSAGRVIIGAARLHIQRPSPFHGISE